MIDEKGISVPSFYDLRKQIREELGDEFDTSEGSVIGMLCDIFANELAELYKLTLQIYDGFCVDYAQGVQLDQLCALNGVIRKPAKKSKGFVTCGGIAGTQVPSGTRVRVGQQGPIFAITESGEIPCDLPIESVDFGPFLANAGAINSVVDFVFGFDSVTNAEPVQVGRVIESDETLRNRRERVVALAQSSTEHGIAMQCETLPNVTHCRVYSNRENGINTVGMPPKSYAVWIYPAPPLVNEQEIALNLWQTMPLGIKMVGTTAYKLFDNQGKEVFVYWNYCNTVSPGISIYVEGIEDNQENDEIIRNTFANEIDKLRVGETPNRFRIAGELSRAIHGMTYAEITFSDYTPVAYNEKFTVDTQDIVVNIDV